eukprot:COSAG06_NODE_11669_length_1479_cov_1.011594_2_plen_262_part_00
MPQPKDRPWLGHNEGWLYRRGRGLVTYVYTAPDGTEFTDDKAAVAYEDELDPPSAPEGELVTMAVEPAAASAASSAASVSKDEPMTAATVEPVAAASAAASASPAVAPRGHRFGRGDDVEVRAPQGESIAPRAARVVQVQTQHGGAIVRRIKVQFDSSDETLWIDLKKAGDTVAPRQPGEGARSGPESESESDEENGEPFSSWIEHGDSGGTVRRLPIARMKRTLTSEKTLPPELLASALQARPDSRLQIAVRNHPLPHHP